MTDKLIVSNRGALRRKYGASGLARIGSALTRLVAADKKRGLVTRVLYLDDTRAMRARRATAVAEPDDYAATKAAIDALFQAESPDYLMIVGAPDVVAHQPLRNPLLDPPDEPDRYAWSDLPYACDGPYCDDTAAFTGPTRVVGRLPDLRGATRAADASHLVSLLRTAATYKSREPEDYAAHFALSAKTWTVSSQRNLFAIFGRSDRLRTSPPSGPRFGAATGAAHAHFINCHGSEGSPEFQGQYGKSYPIALSTRSIAGRIAPGTVAAVECCYGAQLYSAGLIGVDIPICQSYLAQGAYGYFGSTTIAYGDALKTVAADLMAQYFLLEIQEGASLGRAALHARQRYVRESVDLDPTDLKTLAQFILLGDPAVHPVRRDPPASIVPKTVGNEARRTRRRERRAKLAGDGEFLQASRPTASRAAPMPPLATSLRRALATIAKDAGLCTPQRFRVFPLQAPMASVGERTTRSPDRSMKAPSAATRTTRRRYFVAIEKPPGAGAGPRAIAVVVKETAGRIVDVRRYVQR
ncbi:MAG: hypothetical protein IT521_16395 [Burkholderiales bacterium]|nr:hypothetical protein [Burkholderiales bacterium]